MLRKKMLPALAVIAVSTAASAAPRQFDSDHGLKSGYGSLSSCPSIFGQRAILSQGFLLLPCAL